MMFLSKVEEQKDDLMYATFRNIQLTRNHELLEKECKTLAQRIIDSQVSRAEENTALITLKKELNVLKKKRNQDMQVLSLFNDKISSMSSVLEDNISSGSLSLIEDKSLKEILQVKDEMIECLEKKLVEMRLENAEKFAMIKDLTEIENDLKRDKVKLIADNEPMEIANLQDELVAAKLRDSNTCREFWTLKKDLNEMKQQLSQHVEGTRNEKSGKGDGIVKVTASSKLVLWKSSDNDKYKKEIESSELRIQHLQEEALTLQERIKHLENNLETINRLVRDTEITKSKLHEEIVQKKIRHQSQLHLTEERRRQYEYLKNSGDGRLTDIISSIVEKKASIQELSKINDNLCRTVQIEKTTNDFESLEIVEENDKVRNLQREIENLESEIRILKLTPSEPGIEEKAS